MGLVGERSNVWSVTTSLGLEFHNCRSSAFSLAIFSSLLQTFLRFSNFPDSGGEEEEPLVDGGQVLDAVCRQTNDDAFLPFQCYGGSVAGALALTAAHAASFLMLLSLSRLRSEGKAGFAQNSGSSTSLFLSGAKGRRERYPTLGLQFVQRLPARWEEKHLF